MLPGMPASGVPAGDGHSENEALARELVKWRVEDHVVHHGSRAAGVEDGRFRDIGIRTRVACGEGGNHDDIVVVCACPLRETIEGVSRPDRRHERSAGPGTSAPGSDAHVTEGAAAEIAQAVRDEGLACLRQEVVGDAAVDEPVAFEELRHCDCREGDLAHTAPLIRTDALYFSFPTVMLLGTCGSSVISSSLP